MTTGVMISIGICVAVMIGAYFCRNKQTMKKELSGQAASGIILAAVILSGIILYTLVMHPPSVARGESSDTGAVEGMIGMGGGMGMGERPPSPSRDLRGLIGKMSLLQEKDPGTFEAGQVAVLVPRLEALLEPDRLSDEEATAAMTDIRGTLTEKQRADLDALELPRGPRGRRPSPPPGEGGPGGPPPDGGGSMGGSPPGGRGPGSLPPPPGETGMQGGSPTTTGGDGPAAGDSPRQDRRAAFRARMMEIPSVKQAYDEKVAENPAFADDSEAQRDFFRSIMRGLNPFKMGRGKDSLEGLIAGLKGNGAAPEPVPEQ